MQTGQPKVNVDAITAEAKRTREVYEQTRDRALRSLGLEGNTVAIEMLDSVFSLGCAAGSTGESSLVLKEVAETQADALAKMDARRDAEDARTAARHDEMMAVLKTGADALVRLADSIEEFMEEDDEEEDDPVPQPRRPR